MVLWLEQFVSQSFDYVKLYSILRVFPLTERNSPWNQVEFIGIHWRQLESIVVHWSSLESIEVADLE